MYIRSRIQLRLPMGPTRVIELNADDTLATLGQRVSEVGLISNNIIIMTLQIEV